MITYKWRSIFFAARYLINKRRNTRIRRIQRICYISEWWIMCKRRESVRQTLVGIRALAVPFRLPWPICRPFRRASMFLRVRNREWTATGFLIIKPSLINLRTLWPNRRKTKNNSFNEQGKSLCSFHLSCCQLNEGKIDTWTNKPKKERLVYPSRVSIYATCVKTRFLHQRSMIVEGVWSIRDRIWHDLRVLALEISLASLGSSQIFFLPQVKIDEASRFCTRSELNSVENTN